MRKDETAAMPTVRTSVGEGLPRAAADYAKEKISKLARLAHEPVLDVRVRLSRHGDPAVARPVVAQANLDVNGRHIRAQVEAETAWEAVDGLEAPLRHRLERIAGHREARRGRPAPSSVRSVPRDPARLRRLGDAKEQRRIVRVKTYDLARCGVDEAAEELDLLDHDFHFFTEAGTGRDSVLYRAGSTGYRLAQTTPPEPGSLAPYALALTISDHPAARMTKEKAVERLDLTGVPFLFFVDTEQERGCVLYLRHAGDYGLITAAD